MEAKLGPVRFRILHAAVAESGVMKILGHFSANTLTLGTRTEADGLHPQALLDGIKSILHHDHDI